MTFDDILEQVITLLKRQGRVSSGALKMRFDIDDEYLNVLKEELFYVHPVIDDEGKGLIWTGKPGTQPEPVAASQSAQTSHSLQPNKTNPPLLSLHYPHLKTVIRRSMCHRNGNGKGRSKRL